MPGEPGLIQPAGLARPQPGLQPAGGARYPAALPTSGLRRRGCSLPSVLIRHIRANPCSIPALRCRARLRLTRTPTVTICLSAIAYRLSPIAYRLSAIGYRLSAIAYRLRSSARQHLAYQLDPAHQLNVVAAQQVFQAQRRCFSRCERRNSRRQRNQFVGLNASPAHHSALGGQPLRGSQAHLGAAFQIERS
jgi:hypothetical protein